MSETCFVITPFGGKFDDNYLNILSPAIMAAGYEPVRGDDFYGPNPVIEDIRGGIESASVLIADVSGKNPNVNYELGVAHTLDKPVIILANRRSDIPFNIHHLRVIFYDVNKSNWENSLKEKITKSLEAVTDDVDLGRKMALVGKWVGEINQVTNEITGQYDTEQYTLELNFNKEGNTIRGKGQLKIQLGNKPLIELFFFCPNFKDHYIKFEYEGVDPSIIQFGTLLVRLSGDGFKLEGKYVGYGAISDKIVHGIAILHKQLKSERK